MLILTRSPRYPHQTIIAYPDDEGPDSPHAIVIDVLGVQGNQVKIGIHAPDNVKLVRSELVTRPKKLAV